MTVRLYEWEKTVTGGDWIEVTDNKVINLILRNLNNLIKINDNNEVYVELQLEDGLDSTDSLPIWVNVGRVMQADWRPVNGTLISGQTTSWDWVKILYWDDGEIRVDNGTWEWKILQYKLNAWPWIQIWDYTDYSALRWPFTEWFHVPLRSERGDVYWILITTFWLANRGTTIKTYLKMPEAGYRYFSTGAVTAQGESWTYRTANRLGTTSHAFSFNDNYTINPWEWAEQLDYGNSLRWFKDVPVIPDNSWTTLYDWSSVATGAWVFWNSSEWLISMSGDGTTWITIADKNLWATTVYNSWDTLSQSNCGYYYQWWNCYWFAWSGSITLSDLNAQVDASVYWPWNYYSSDTFYIWTYYQWDSSGNNNLRWWVTWIVEIKNAITNTWVLSVNWETGHVTVDTTPIVPVWDTLPSTPVEWSVFFNTTDSKLYIYDGTDWYEIQSTIVS